MYWLSLSRPASIYMVSSGLVGRDFRLRVPDVSPAYVAGLFKGDCFNCSFWSAGGLLVIEIVRLWPIRRCTVPLYILLPANLPFAPQWVCARSAYAIPKTLMLAKFGFVELFNYGCEQHVLQVLCCQAFAKPRVSQSTPVGARCWSQTVCSKSKVQSLFHF